MDSIEPTELSRWFDAFGPALVLYARQWLPAEVAEDVVQDVFVRLMAQRAAPANVKAWLFRSVRNAAISQIRSRHRSERHAQQASEARPRWFEGRPDDPIDAKTAQDALRSLPHEQREVIVLRIWCEMTLEEIAGIVEQPVSTLFSRYKAGLAAIRKRLEAPCPTKKT